MKKVGLLIATAVMLVLFAFSASAAQNGYYTYEVENGEATITDVDTSISGEVTIPSTLGGYKVTSIGDWAFYNCDSLTSVTIPDSVTSIGDSAFESCDSLTSVTIPDSVTSIGDSTFYSCDSLTSVTIGDSVTSIGYRAFYNCDSLTSVTIGDSVTSIGNWAFEYCSNLTSVTIGDGATSIGDYAFHYCSSLTSITIPDSVTSIGDYAFMWCTSLASVTIGDGATSIGDYAFYYCSSLTSITIPDSVTSIGDRAFYSCYRLTSVTIGDSVTSIGAEAFEDCDSLTSVTIPDSVTSIGAEAFCSCDSLTSISIPDSVTSIGNSAFAGCDSLTSVTIGDSVTSIGYDAFYNCSSLESITIGNSVTSIGSSVFMYCDSLTSVTIPDSVTSIGESAFEYCPIKDVYYTGTRSQWNAIKIASYNYSLKNATIHYTHKNIVDFPQQDPTCTKIGYTAGKQCSDCKEWLSGHETIAKLGHSYSSSYTTDKKATLSANGSKSRHCTRDGCTAKTSVTTIARVSSFTLSTTNYVYDGKNKTPKVTVKDADGRQLVKNVDYKTSIASSRSSVGKHYVKVTLMGNYSGTKNVYFYIRPDAPKTIKATQSTSWIKLTWDKVNGAAGYSVYRYDTKTSTYKKLKATTATSYTDKNLYAGKKYIYKIVPYGRDADKNVYYSKSSIIIKTATKTKTPILSDYAVYKGKVKLFWTSTGGETGYQVWYSTQKDSGFKRYANYSSNTGYVNNLTSGKTYYFKVRTYIKTDSGYVYSDWSNVKGIKIK